MFYYLVLKKSIDIHPKNFGKRLREVIQEKVISEVRRAHALGLYKLPRPLRVMYVLARKAVRCGWPLPHTQTEGTCNGKYGYVVAVTSIDSIGQVRLGGFIAPCVRTQRGGVGGAGDDLHPATVSTTAYNPYALWMHAYAHAG